MSTPSVPAEKLPISPARTPTKALTNTHQIQDAPATPVRFRKPQAPNDSDPGFTNLMYRLRQDRTGLKLPDKYEALERMQYALDHTIMFATAQNSVCHFHKIKKPVENMSRRFISFYPFCIVNLQFIDRPSSFCIIEHSN
jgi:hypothetical protein